MRLPKTIEGKLWLIALLSLPAVYISLIFAMGDLPPGQHQPGWVAWSTWPVMVVFTGAIVALIPIHLYGTWRRYPQAPNQAVFALWMGLATLLGAALWACFAAMFVAMMLLPARVVVENLTGPIR